MVARITGEAGLLQAAEDLARAVLSLPAVFPWYAYMARAALGLVAVQRGDAAAAQKQYEALESLPAILIHYITRDRTLGLLAQSMARLDQAAGHFEDALAFGARAEYRPEWAWSACEYAQCLLERQGSGDITRAKTLLEEAAGICAELEMATLRSRVLILQEQLHSDSPIVETHPDGLTRREVEVLELVAAGKSNNEIAGGLFLSVRTVERHLTNIYTKINVRSRAEATAYYFGRTLAG